MPLSVLRVGRSGSYLAEPLLVPEGADDECHEPPFLKPAEGQLRAQVQKVADLIQVQGTVPRNRYKGWRGAVMNTVRETKHTLHRKTPSTDGGERK